MSGIINLSTEPQRRVSGDVILTSSASSPYLSPIHRRGLHVIKVFFSVEIFLLFSLKAHYKGEMKPFWPSSSKGSADSLKGEDRGLGIQVRV